MGDFFLLFLFLLIQFRLLVELFFVVDSHDLELSIKKAETRVKPVVFWTEQFQLISIRRRNVKARRRGGLCLLALLTKENN